MKFIWGILAFVIIIFIIIKIYFRSYIEVIKSFKLLKKALDTRDILLLKILPDVRSKKIVAKTVSAIESRNKMSKISYNDALKADAKLHNELRELYEIINSMPKDNIQIEIFKRVIALEKSIKKLRREYSKKANSFNIDLTMHVTVLVKMFHLRPLDTYKEE